METLEELMVMYPGLIIRVNQKARSYKIFEFKTYMAKEKNNFLGDNNILYFCRIQGYDFKAHGSTFRSIKRTHAMMVVNLKEEK